MTNNNLDERASTTGQIYPKEKANPKQKEAIFILCESCYWSATYFGKFMLPAEERCPICLEIELLFSGCFLLTPFRCWATLTTMYL